MLMETTVKINYFCTKGGCSNYFIPREILHHVKLDYKKHCSMPLLSYVRAHDIPTLTNTVHAHALDCLFLHAIQTKQGGYEYYHIPTCQAIRLPYVTVIPATASISATIDALCKSDGIKNLKITNLHNTFYLIPPTSLLCLQEWMMQMTKTLPLQECMMKTLLLQECLNPTLLSQQMQMMTWMQNPITTLLTPMGPMTIQSKASIHSTRSHIPILNRTSEPPQRPLDKEEL